jgi:hypothetical protein
MQHFMGQQHFMGRGAVPPCPKVSVRSCEPIRLRRRIARPRPVSWSAQPIRRRFRPVVLHDWPARTQTALCGATPFRRRGEARVAGTPRRAAPRPALLPYGAPAACSSPPRLALIGPSPDPPSQATCINRSPARRAWEPGRKARPPRCVLAAVGPGRRGSSLTRVRLQAACLMPIDVAVVEGAPPHFCWGDSPGVERGPMARGHVAGGSTGACMRCWIEEDATNRVVVAWDRAMASLRNREPRPSLSRRERGRASHLASESRRCLRPQPLSASLWGERVRC